MKKRRYFAVVGIAVLCCILVQCGGQKPGFLQSGLLRENGKPEATAKIREKEKVKTLPPVSRRVLFIGNSLIEYGAQADFLEDIAWGYGKNITVDQLTYGGAWLRDYCDKGFVEIKTVKRKMKKADIVVFQDYGGWQGDNTFSAIKKLRKWCKKSAKLYYYMYDYDHLEMSPADYKRLRKWNLSFIPKGEVIDSMYELGYSYDELHVPNDYHPNGLNGYLSALLMHAVLFEEKCADFPREWFPDKRKKMPFVYQGLKKSIHGKTGNKKWKEFQKICQRIDEMAVKAEEY